MAGYENLLENLHWEKDQNVLMETCCAMSPAGGRRLFFVDNLPKFVHILCWRGFSRHRERRSKHVLLETSRLQQSVVLRRGASLRVGGESVGEFPWADPWAPGGFGWAGRRGKELPGQAGRRADRAVGAESKDTLKQDDRTGYTKFTFAITPDIVI